MPDLPTISAILAGLLLLAAIGPAWRRCRHWLMHRNRQRAMDQFRMQREYLEARFLDLARVRGKPRDVRWVECDWQPEVAFAMDLNERMLTAFVAVNVRFEAVEGGDMEDVEAVGTIRDAAALFHYHKGRWGTGGRALFNMNPHDAIVRLAGQFAPLESLESRIRGECG